MEPFLALDASHAWLAAAALVSGLLAYVGAMVGLVLGQFRLPLLVLALGAAPAAAASNLAISSLGAATGALAHAREGRVDPRLILSIGLPSAIAAYVSSRMLTHVDAWWIEAVIGGSLLVSALPLACKAWTMRERESTPTATRATTIAVGDPTPVVDDHRPLDARALTIEIVIGAALGALSGVVGLLLGTLRLPAMLRLGVSPPRAAGTNMAIGFFTGVGGALGALGSGRVSALAFALVGGTTLLGAWLGARRTKTLPRARHFAVIAAVLMVVGVWLGVKAILGPR
ncbi:sulfite exporter TauE/SafE family protein [Nannocystaceae bacterium ST9]